VHAVAQPHVRVVTTLRADFLPQCAAIPDLAPLLQAPAALYLLTPPGPAALADMIRRPAERAGVALEDGLADEILQDAGTDPGALPLIAFCLEELYRQTTPDRRLTVKAYDTLGRLRGAISRRAAALLEELRKIGGADLDAALSQVFRALVHVDAAGKATRRRAYQDELGDTAQIRPIINELVKGRLLAVGNADGRATVMLAHEALLQEWSALYEWLDCHRAQLQRIQMLIAALGDADRVIRERAAEALRQIGPAVAEAMPALTVVLGNALTRWDTIRIFVKIGPAAVPGLITAPRNAKTEIRVGAVEALKQFGPTAAPAVPALMTALHDAEAEVRWVAGEALGQIGLSAVPALITALGHPEAKVRQNVAFALGRIGPAAAAAVPALITTLSDAEVYWNALQALVVRMRHLLGALDHHHCFG
jgi:hypothetical protein